MLLLLCPFDRGVEEARAYADTVEVDAKLLGDPAQNRSLVEREDWEVPDQRAG